MPLLARMLASPLHLDIRAGAVDNLATLLHERAITSGGPLKADVVQYPKRIGKTAIEMIAKHLRGEQVPAVMPIEVGLWKKGS